MVVNESFENEEEKAEMPVTSDTVKFKPPVPPPPYSELPEPRTELNTLQAAPVIQNTIIVQQPNLKTTPVLFTCPMCQAQVVTRVHHINTKKTHLMAGFICGFTFWCMLCCLAALPYVLPTFKKTEHYCPNCKSLLGSYSIV